MNHKRVPQSLHTLIIETFFDKESSRANPNNLITTPQEYSLKALPHQSSNQTYQLALHHDQLYFVKSMEDTAFIPFDRRERFQLQQALSEQGWAPQPIALSYDKMWQIEQWKKPECAVSRSQLIVRAGELLAQLHTCVNLHALGVDVPQLDLVAHWRHYLSLVKPEQIDEFETQIQVLSEQWHNLEKHCLCHHDLALNHISSMTQPCLYDWEYGAFGNAIFDIACAIVINQLTENEVVLLLQSYCEYRGQYANADALIEQVDRVRPLVSLTNALWLAAYSP